MGGTVAQIGAKRNVRDITHLLTACEDRPILRPCQRNLFRG
jgi:hypothetical protein